MEYVNIDISSDDSVQNAAEYVKNKYNKLNILINNAGLASKGTLIFISMFKCVYKYIQIYLCTYRIYV